MAHIKVENISIAGISACVPSTVEENSSLPFFKGDEAGKFIASTGIERRHIADVKTTSGDLCYKAAEDLIAKLDWKKDDIDCLIFVSQSPDYLLPATSCILQGRLGLKEGCYTIDISYGCPGWVYGLSVIASLMSSGCMKKGLLLVGDTPSKFKSRNDRTSWPLFGDAGTATAIEYVSEADPMYFTFSTEGVSYQSIIIPDGGARNPVTESSLKEVVISEGIARRPLDSEMDSMSVFAFGLKRAPESVLDILEYAQAEIDAIDLFVFHQANYYMLEKIRKKLKIPAEKVPYCLQDYGNTSCATIPLTLATQCSDILTNKKKKVVATAFGVGLSWGSVLFSLDLIQCLSIQ
ncbi:3-oxoacyl-ACP synthase [Bacteroidia bacterium]|nr:3-oxoacyl-ACP synthase [Bacteroidia bacterium]